MSALLGADLPAMRAALREARGGEEEPDDRVAEVFARSVWSGIVEPGDQVAGAFVTGLGAPAALEWVQSGGSTLPDDRASAALGQGLQRWRRRLDAGAAAAALRNAGQVGARLLVPTDPRWPRGLHDLGDGAPLALWVRGGLESFDALHRSVALVGARAASPYGEQVAIEASGGLVDRGFAVVSGAALGIDGVAHRSALTSGGITVAVLAGGVDRLYPLGHAELLRRIERSGAVVAELPCGFSPIKSRFLSRNRLIAAMSRATVVIEAGSRSGALNTAAHAAEIGRPLGAVPGSVLSAASTGCHRLLREHDAVCVRHAADMAELAVGLEESLPALDLPRDPGERRVLDALTRTARTVPELARRGGLGEAEVAGALALLELTGAAARSGDGWRRG